MGVGKSMMIAGTESGADEILQHVFFSVCGRLCVKILSSFPVVVVVKQLSDEKNKNSSTFNSSPNAARCYFISHLLTRPEIQVSPEMSTAKGLKTKFFTARCCERIIIIIITASATTRVLTHSIYKWFVALVGWPPFLSLLGGRGGGGTDCCVLFFLAWAEIRKRDPLNRNYSFPPTESTRP